MYKNTIWITLTLLFCSCVDDKYDFGKEVEIKVGFADDGLTLPTSSTQPIALSQVIELNENGQLTTDPSGNYLFHKSVDKMDSTVINIGQGSICNATETLIDYHFKEDPDLQRTTVSEKYNTARLNFEISALPDYAPDNMSKSIRELDYIKTGLSISFIIYNNNVDEFASEISEIKYQVPSFYDLEDPSELTETHVRLGSQHEHIIHCKGVDFNAATAAGEEIGFDSSTGKLTFKGKVGMTCTINTAHMKEYEAMADPQIQARVTVGTLGTNEVTGRFSKTENVDIDPIELDDLPDIVRDEEVVIDLENPIVNLTINNEVPIGAMVNARLHSIRDGKEVASLDIGDIYGTAPIYFSPSSRQTVTVSRRPLAQLPDTVSSNVVVDNIMDILKIMPDKIEVEGFAHTDSSQVVTMSLNKEYRVYPQYELLAPLVIGPKMKLVYRKATEDLHDKLKHLEINQITMSAKAKSNIPLDLTATMTAKDEQGNEIADITLEQSQTIKGMSESDITLVLKGSIEDFQRVYSIETTAYGECNEALAGQPLNENQAIRLEDIKVTVK